jgi:hypothetical protein
VPLIPSVGVNLVTMLSQVELLLMKEEHVQEQVYPLIEAMQEGGVPHNMCRKMKRSKRWLHFNPIHKTNNPLRNYNRLPWWMHLMKRLLQRETNLKPRMFN